MRLEGLLEAAGIESLTAASSDPFHALAFFAKRGRNWHAQRSFHRKRRSRRRGPFRLCCVKSRPIRSSSGLKRGHDRLECQKNDACPQRGEHESRTGSRCLNSEQAGLPDSSPSFPAGFTSFEANTPVSNAPIIPPASERQRRRVNRYASSSGLGTSSGGSAHF